LLLHATYDSQSDEFIYSLVTHQLRSSNNANLSAKTDKLYI